MQRDSHRKPSCSRPPARAPCWLHSTIFVPLLLCTCLAPTPGPLHLRACLPGVPCCQGLRWLSPPARVLPRVPPLCTMFAFRAFVLTSSGFIAAVPSTARILKFWMLSVHFLAGCFCPPVCEPHSVLFVPSSVPRLFCGTQSTKVSLCTQASSALGRCCESG